MREVYFLYYNLFFREDIRKQLKQLDCVLMKKPSNELSNTTKKLSLDQRMISKLHMSIYNKYNGTDMSKSEILNLLKKLAKRHWSAIKMGKARKIRIIKDCYISLHVPHCWHRSIKLYYRSSNHLCCSSRKNHQSTKSNNSNKWI